MGAGRAENFGWAEVEAAARAALRDMPVVTQVVADAIRASVPEYAYVSDEDLRGSIEQNVTALILVVAERRFLTPTELAVFESTVEARARSGVALDQYHQAVAAAEASVWDELWRHAPSPVSSEQLLAAFSYRFAALKTITRATATAHRRVELLTAREDYERRAIALRSLLDGSLSRDGVREHSGRLGLDTSRAYWVVRARARAGADSDRVQRLLAGAHNQPPHAVFALWGDDVVGLLTDAPESSEAYIAGIAGPVPVEGLSLVHEDAMLAFATAWALGLPGLHSTGELGLRTTVQQVASMGQALRQKYLAPLHATGHLGNELLTTVRAYLEEGGRREGAAARVHVHINTVGYRLGRFCELTGADLSDLQTLAELWWLFEDLDQRPA